MQKRCDYANVTTSGGHGPATQSKGGYNICQKCYDAIIDAEKKEQTYYDAINEKKKDEAYQRQELLKDIAERLKANICSDFEPLLLSDVIRKYNLTETEQNKILHMICRF